MFYVYLSKILLHCIVCHYFVFVSISKLVLKLFALSFLTSPSLPPSLSIERLTPAYLPIIDPLQWVSGCYCLLVKLTDFHSVFPT